MQQIEMLKYVHIVFQITNLNVDRWIRVNKNVEASSYKLYI
jgi:hypothetical protein